MTFNDSETGGKRYTLRPTFTPLPKTKKHAETQSGAGKEPPPVAHSESETVQAKRQNPAASVIRAANEDDDLYDPYSDYHDGTLKAAEFEEDPWR